MPVNADDTVKCIDCGHYRMKDAGQMGKMGFGLLKLADNTRYTPDFLVLLPDGVLEIHETKDGYIREDGWLKLKVAAGMFPFRFFLCQKATKKDGGEWSIRRV
ncbi:MAG: hypothetical protein LBO00_10330 [Zoogloeaceae bacterium]|jgi:hypothetical protein|nr:hypothetical protein [Zoogloeaceae bacterium]